MPRRYPLPVYGRVLPPDDGWLARAEPEPVLDPARPIVDTHMHLWHLPDAEPYFLPEFARDAAECGHRIEATVFVECHAMYRADGPDHLRPVGETRFALGQAAMADSLRYTGVRAAAGIVAFADLTLGNAVRETLDAHAEAAGGRLRGIRQRSKWDTNPAVRGPWGSQRPGLYRTPEFAGGMRLLAEHGLSFDASIYHPEMPDVTALARAHPDVTVVLIHTGSPVGHGPYAADPAENFAAWRRDAMALAACPNVVVKLGGMVMNLANYDFAAAGRPIGSAALSRLWRPYLESCLELFGVERCMVSSNFPVDKAGFGYGTVWNMFKHFTAGCSEVEKTALFSGTARRVYRLS